MATVLPPKGSAPFHSSAAGTKDAPHDSKRSSPRELRADIQALRGYAVLAVLLYHARLGVLPAGYLGVDVFFVISGFLITRLIVDALDNGAFRFSDFYFRRAKRLLPASYVALFGTVLLAPLFLASSEIRDLRAQIFGAITFTANFVLWQQAGYFGGPAELKPLLHVWSLAIEEQFYFLLPAALVFTPRRFWKRGIGLVLVASLALCLALGARDSSFYLLPTRSWELAIGSLGTLMAPGHRVSRFLRYAFWPSVIVLLGLPLVQFGGAHPGPVELLACLATLILLVRRHAAAPTWTVTRGLSKIGDMSYSLYLVHWPLFAFANNTWVGGNDVKRPLALQVSLVGLSVVLGFLLNRYVEEPVRRAKFRPTARLLGMAAATSLALSLTVVGIARVRPMARDYAQVRRVNFGLSGKCDFAGDFRPRPECRNGQTPELLIWGDSYAMHLVAGILSTSAGAPPMVQATRSVCGPLLGLAAIRDQRYDRAWAESCIRFNESVISYLRQESSIRTVVLSSPFTQYVTGDARLVKLDRHSTDRNRSYNVVAGNIGEANEGLRRTIEAVRALGKRVVVVGPPPSGDFDIGRCLERVERGLPVTGVDDDCRIDRDTYRASHEAVLAFLAGLPRQIGVDVISFDEFLCNSRQCRTHVDSTFIYRDGGHFSYEGSAFVANGLGLVAEINRLAR